MRVLLAGVVLLAAGCDLLFPELTPKQPDMAQPDGGGDGGGPPHIAGRVCALGDLRDYRTCAGAAGMFRIGVEETRESVMTDPTGVFVLPLSKKLDKVVLAAVDPSG